jgi:hypothetical protein
MAAPLVGPDGQVLNTPLANCYRVYDPEGLRVATGRTWSQTAYKQHPFKIIAVGETSRQAHWLSMATRDRSPPPLPPAPFSAYQWFTDDTTQALLATRVFLHLHTLQIHPKQTVCMDRQCLVVR